MNFGLFLLVFVIWLFANGRFNTWLNLAITGEVPEILPDGIGADNQTSAPSEEKEEGGIIEKVTGGLF